jgi:hypothetical protein
MLIPLILLSFVLNIVVLVMLSFASFKFFFGEYFNIQLGLIIIFGILILPMIFLQNFVLIYHHIWELSFTFSPYLFLIFSILGVIGVFVYNFHLLTVVDLPLPHIIGLSTTVGVALSAMIISVKFNPFDIQSPISYEPILGGKILIICILIMNFGGFSVFIHSLFIKSWRETTIKVSNIELIAILIINLTPFIMMVQRLSGLILPVTFNFYLMVAQFALILHLVAYLIYNESGYPTYSDLRSLIIVDLDSNLVLGGFSTKDKRDTTTLSGMAILALENVVNQIFYREDLDPRVHKIDKYGDAFLIREKNLLLAAWLTSEASNIGRFVFTRLLKRYHNYIEEGKSKEAFVKLMMKYLYTFINKKVENDKENIYINEGLSISISSNQ